MVKHSPQPLPQAGLGKRLHALPCCCSLSLSDQSWRERRRKATAAPCPFPNLHTVPLGAEVGGFALLLTLFHQEETAALQSPVWGRCEESFPAALHPPGLQKVGQALLPTASPNWNHSSLRKSQRARKKGAAADWTSKLLPVLEGFLPQKISGSKNECLYTTWLWAVHSCFFQSQDYTLKNGVNCSQSWKLIYLNL